MDLLAFSSRQLRHLCFFSAFLLNVHSSFRERSGRRPAARERSPCKTYKYITLHLAKAHRGEKTHSVEEAQRGVRTGAQRGVTAKCPKSFYHPDIPLRCSQLITGNPYNTPHYHHILILSKHTINSLPQPLLGAA